MRKFQILEYPNGELTLFYAAPEENHDEFWTLALLIGKQYPQAPWSVTRAALSMLPTHPELPWRMDALKDSQELIAKLFIGSDEESSAIAELHTFEHPHPPKPPKEWIPGDPFTEEHLEFPTGGDSRCDSIASLLASTDLRATDVLELRRWLSREELARTLYTSQELLKGSKKRIEEMIDATAQAAREGRAVDAETGEIVDIDAIVALDQQQLNRR